jgi:hypothetical protein
MMTPSMSVRYLVLIRRVITGIYDETIATVYVPLLGYWIREKP